MQKSCCNCRKIFYSGDNGSVGDNCSPKCSEEFDEYIKSEVNEGSEAKEE